MCSLSMPATLGEVWCSWSGTPYCHEGFWEWGLGLQTSVLLITEREMEEVTHNAQDTGPPPTLELNKLNSRMTSEYLLMINVCSLVVLGL